MNHEHEVLHQFITETTPFRLNLLTTIWAFFRTEAKVSENAEDAHSEVLSLTIPGCAPENLINAHTLWWPCSLVRREILCLFFDSVSWMMHCNYSWHGWRISRQRMCLQPHFVPRAVQLAMMAATQRNRKLVADLATECLPLDKAQMMRATLDGGYPRWARSEQRGRVRSQVHAALAARPCPVRDRSAEASH
jgi:hypothetical protein